MRKGITALLDQQGKEIFNEGLKINLLKDISRSWILDHITWNKKETKSNRENVLKRCFIFCTIISELKTDCISSPFLLKNTKIQVYLHTRV